MLHWRLTILGRSRPALIAMLLAPLGAVPVADHLLPQGLAAFSQTATMLESFRAAATQELPLPEMVRYMDSSLMWGMREFYRQEPGFDAHFVTLAVAEIPDGQPLVRLILCGHPSPLLLRGGTVRTLAVPDPAPPLGLGAMGNDPYHPRTFRYEPGELADDMAMVAVRREDIAARDSPDALRQLMKEAV